MLDIPEHLQWIIDSHQKVIQLIGSFVVLKYHFKDERIQSSDPVNHPAPRGLSSQVLPVGHDLESLTKISDLGELSLIEHISSHKIKAMLDYCLSQKVVTALMSLVNSSQHEHHIIEQLCLNSPSTDISNTLGNRLIYPFGGVSINQDDPLVYNIPLGFEL